MTPLEEARFHLDRARLDLRHALAVQRQERPDRHFDGLPECPHVIAANDAVTVCMSRWRAAVRAKVGRR